MTASIPALELIDVRKEYGPVTALRSVSLALPTHGVLGLVGENGAGKSTLISIINGTVHPTAGVVRVNGQEMDVGHPTEAGRLGIATVFQEQGLVPNLPVYENILLGREDKFSRAGLLDVARMIRVAREVLAELQIDINPTAITGDLPFGKRQLVEIAKAFALGRIYPVQPIILLDEPTSALSEAEKQLLFTSIRRWRGKASIIFVSHHLSDVFEICDEVAALKDGTLTGQWNISDVTPESLHEAIVGRSRPEAYYKEADQRDDLGEVVLSVRGLELPGEFSDISFEVRAGEIVGIAGVMGSGKVALGHALAGSVRPSRGEIKVNGQRLVLGSRLSALGAGVGFVPAERNEAGAIGMHSVEWNLTLPNLPAFRRRWLPLLSGTAQAEATDRWIDRLRIKATGRRAQMRSLSGGNAQKVVFAKWLERRISLFVLDDPGRGVDVGAKEEIYALLRQLSRDGVAIVLISDSLPEIIGLSNRILTLKGGRITSEIDAPANNKPGETTVVACMV